MKERRDPVTVMTEMVAALVQAEGGATQLIQHYRNPKMFLIRDSITAVKELSVRLSPHNQLIKPKMKSAKTGKIVV